MIKKINFLDIPLDALTMDETINKIDEAIFLNKQVHHCVINAGKVVKIQSDKILKESVINSDIINADGMSIVWAARFLGYNIPERVAGIDLMENLIRLAHKKGYSCFFLGARKQVVEKIINVYSSKYSKKIIAGFRNGYFDEQDEREIIKKIKESDANFLFVAITSPKKEIFLNKYKNELKNINLIMGVGGSFDVIAGTVKRAPKYIQDLGLEWFYRFAQEPKRMWKRYLIGNFKFVILILKAKFFSSAN
jgi:N-acetylglucosaminyldiphosphoundecaprenol N-acetyl-beta-D-mannosaminyltransferase